MPAAKGTLWNLALSAVRHAEKYLGIWAKLLNSESLEWKVAFFECSAARCSAGPVHAPSVVEFIGRWLRATSTLQFSICSAKSISVKYHVTFYCSKQKASLGE